MNEYYGIQLDLEKDKLFDKLGLQRLKDSYMLPEETSPQQRFAFVSSTFSSNPEHAQRLYKYASNHWLSYATPILSYGRSKRGLPISCYLSYIDDSASGLVDTLSETNWLSMMGGGVGLTLGIRSSDDKSTGVMPHLKVYDASSLAYRQGTTRRGSYATYLDISHPDILLFLEMRKPTGDPNIRCMNLHHGVNISDSFMEIIERCMIDPYADDSWQLIDPASKEVKEVVSAKEIWQKIIDLRMHTGEPYIHFVDTSNRFLPEWLKKQGLKVHGSNLCSEILLPTSKERTAVCCLSSVNLEYFDEWKDDPNFLPDILEMLDNVLDKFIEDAPDVISRAKFSAQRERSVGIGALGFHAYLQKKNVPFEGPIAKGINNKIFSHIRSQLDVKNRQLAVERGEAPDALGYGVRNSHIMAIAPNACQLGTNKIQVKDKVCSLHEILAEQGINWEKIEQTNDKQWINFRNPLLVPTLSGFQESHKVWYNGYEECYEIEFEDGNTYSFTGNHRLLVISNGLIQWKLVKDLSEKDNVLQAEDYISYLRKTPKNRRLVNVLFLIQNGIINFDNCFDLQQLLDVRLNQDFFKLCISYIDDAKSLRKLLQFVKTYSAEFLEFDRYQKYCDYRKMNNSDSNSITFFQLIYGEELSVKKKEEAKMRKGSPYDPHSISVKHKVPLNKAYEISKQRKRKTAGTLENFINRHGQILGLKKFEEFKSKSKHTIENYQKWYPNNWQEKWEYFLSTRDSSSPEYFVRKFGEYPGWQKDYEIYKSKFLLTKEKLIYKYGPNLGLQKFKEMNKKKRITKDLFIQKFGKNGDQEYKKFCKSKATTYKNLLSKYGPEEAKIKYTHFCLTKAKTSSLYDFGTSKAARDFFIQLEKEIHRNIGLFKCIYANDLISQAESFFIDYDNNRVYYVDFLVEELKIIIEYHGTHCHAPLSVSEEEKQNWKNAYNHISWDEQFKKDNDRKNFLEKLGYKYLVVWSNEDIYDSIDNFVKIMKEKLVAV